MIAKRLDIAEAAVKVRLKCLLRKVGASNRTQAAIEALDHGIGQGAR
jgi:two-component system nitrate/nitrite response regulator NarL